MSDVSDRLEEYARTQRRLERLIRLQSAGLMVLGLALAVGCATVAADDGEPHTLRVSELVVVDPAGVERVRIGGDLPDAVIDGKVVPRGESAAGVLLYDDTGQERGGYVTWESGNVGLTLDTRQRQATFFIASPEGGSALRMWHDDHAITLRSDGDGSRLTITEGSQILLQQPPVEAVGPEACEAYRGALERVSRAEVLSACSQRFPETACRACIGAD